MACIAPSESMNNCEADQALTKNLQPVINFSSILEDEETDQYTDNVHENSYILGIKEYIANSRNLHLSKVISREKRAAVLICLFEGLEGELRVILTKRSMKLSTHPGNISNFFFCPCVSALKYD